ncbi:ATP-binding cassette domain-containing protein [Streptomyces hirsutus]|uniref:ATP-binding cassette domain-containing protein n=1 Tax=Streptomyces hirsutus TaxID=35620 RepID=UPI00331E40D2
MTEKGAIATDRSPSTAVLRVRGVTKSFGGAAALKGVGLDLHPGEIHALMGMNGAGKPTLVQILSGAHQADGGTVEVEGVPLARWLGHRGVGETIIEGSGDDIDVHVVTHSEAAHGRFLHRRTSSRGTRDATR